jgi:hypothetical protein
VSDKICHSVAKSNTTSRSTFSPVSNSTPAFLSLPVVFCTDLNSRPIVAAICLLVIGPSSRRAVTTSCSMVSSVGGWITVSERSKAMASAENFVITVNGFSFGPTLFLRWVKVA